MTESRRPPGEEENHGVYEEGEPKAVPIDKETEQRELEEAGWVREEREGKILWRNPVSEYLYPQGAAIALLREGRVPDLSGEEQEEGD